MLQGVVKWFNPPKGYGFITTDELPGEDIMVHFSDINMEGYQKLEEDQEVYFEIIDTGNGPKAVDVYIKTRD